MEQAVKMGRRDLAELEGPGVPDLLGYLLEWFHELAAARGSGMNGFNPIGFAEIEAWARLTGRTPSALEVGALMRMDFESRHPRDEE
tara:strand:- start:1832 stop:2092 length:261 start_codon:yes stop_codon:yes gene_type:complete